MFAYLGTICHAGLDATNLPTQKPIIFVECVFVSQMCGTCVEYCFKDHSGGIGMLMGAAECMSGAYECTWMHTDAYKKA